jgi:dTMP kinase
MFITFEGLDGSGKTTQVKLLADRLSRQNQNVLVLREPGGTEVGEKIRAILLDRNIHGMTTVSEFFLFSASRAQLVEEVIRPALAGGIVVLCDRFYDSSTAYQGWGRKLPLDAIEVINRCATGGLTPDLTFFLDLPVADVEKRINRLRGKDRMESIGQDFYERVRQGYLEIARNEPRFRIVDGKQDIDSIHEIIWSHVEQMMAQPARAKEA